MALDKRNKTVPDAALDALLATWRITVDSGDAAVDAMTRAARIRAVQLKDGLERKGFFGLVAALFGFRRASGAAWSALAGMGVALVIGISLGASDALPTVDETAFSVDFDSVLGAGTLTSTAQADQDL